MTIIYRGWRTDNGDCRVTVQAEGKLPRRLPMRLDLFNHSPTGPEWGYAGSGPAQLALALLAHVLQDDERAVRLHQRFKFAVIAPMPRDASYRWEFTSDDILARVAEIEAKANGG